MRDILRGIRVLACLTAAACVLLGSGVVASGQDAPVYPDDTFSRPSQDVLLNFSTMSGVYVGPGTYSRAALFHRNSTRLVNGPDGTFRTEWRFRRRAGTNAGTSLMIDERIRRQPDRITFRVENRSDRTVAFSLSGGEIVWRPANEGPSHTWRIGDVQDVPAGGEAVLDYSFASAEIVGAAGPSGIAYPLSSLTIAPTPLEDGVDYHFILSDLTVHYPPASDITVVAIEATPTALVADEEARIAVRASGVAVENLIDLELRRDAWVLWRIRLTDDERTALAERGTCEAIRQTPWHLPEGDYALGLVADGYRANGAEAAVHMVNALHAELPQMERRMHNGRPTAFANGEPFNWSGYSSYDFSPGNVAQFAQGNLTAVCVPASVGRHVHHHAAPPTVVAPGVFDFGSIDERVTMALQAQPDAMVFLRLSLAPPLSWMQENEDAGVAARIRVDLGDLDHTETGARQASHASEVWQRYQTDLLRAVIEHCKAQPWAGRLAGIWPTSGVTEEWFSWGSNEGLNADYSTPNHMAFLAWCQERGFNHRGMPDIDVRKSEGYDIYPPTHGGGWAAAYAQYASESTAATIDTFGRVIKEATDGRTFVGAFYGYVLQLAGEPRQHFSGHFALRKMLESANVDFLATIPLHDFRMLDNGYSSWCSASESILAAGKLVCNENDLFSWLHPLHWYTEYNPSDPRAGAISMHRRTFANDAVHGGQRQYFSLAASWHDDEALQQEFAELVALNRTVMGMDRTGAEEIAFVVDDSSFAWTTPGSQLGQQTNKHLLRALGQTGAPVGVWLLSDVDRLPDQIRFVVVANAFAPRPADLAKLEALIEEKNGSKTFLLIGPIGLVNPEKETWDLSAPARLTGLPVRVANEEGTGIARWSENGQVIHPIETIRPRAYLGSRSGFMTYNDGVYAGDDRPLGRDHRVIWCGVAPVSAYVLRPWLVRAGVHFYAPVGFFVHASKDLVAITASAGTMAKIQWPRASRVTDLFDGLSLEGKVTECLFATGQTRLFRREEIAEK